MHILLADDHPIFRKGLKALITDHYNGCVVDEVDNGSQAIDKLNHEKYTICILDIDMPEKSGIDVLRYMKDKDLSTKAIILTMHNDELFFNESFDEGAVGFLLKEDSSLEIVECLDEVQLGNFFVSKKISPFLKNRRSFKSQMHVVKNAIDSLTNAEFNTLKLVAENKTSKEISELLFVTEKSVENYRSRICKKLDLKGGSNTLYRWCIENKNMIVR